MVVLTAISVVFVVLTLTGLAARRDRPSSTSRANAARAQTMRMQIGGLEPSQRVMPWESTPENTPPIPTDSPSVPAWQIPSERPVDEPPREKPAAPDPWLQTPMR
jgi:hypothetical protein